MFEKDVVEVARRRMDKRVRQSKMIAPTRAPLPCGGMRQVLPHRGAASTLPLLDKHKAALRQRLFELEQDKARQKQAELVRRRNRRVQRMLQHREEALARSVQVVAPKVAWQERLRELTENKTRCSTAAYGIWVRGEVRALAEAVVDGKSVEDMASRVHDFATCTFRRDGRDGPQSSTKAYAAMVSHIL